MIVSDVRHNRQTDDDDGNGDGNGVSHWENLEADCDIDDDSR
jgi:hypothetical protein